METFTLNNKLISRSWAFNENKLYTTSIKDVCNDIEYVKKPLECNDFLYEGLTCETRRFLRDNPYGFELKFSKKEKFTDNIYTNAGEKLTIFLEDSYHGLKVNYIAILYKDCSAIKTYLEIEAFNMPEDYFFEKRYNVLDTYPVSLKDSHITSYEFFTRTDHTNHLIEKKEDAIDFDKGNVIIADYNNHGLFFLKESPVYTDCQPESLGHFYIANDFISTVGTGIMPHEFKQEIMTTYGSVVGVYKGCESTVFLSLKNYQSKASHYYPMILANPWGDRQWMKHINEEFVIEEIKAASKLGAEYYQLDDGWNEGFGLIHVVYAKKMDQKFWDIKHDLFPNGFKKIKEVAKKHNVKLALWIGLDCSCMYRNYIEQADIIYDMYQNYGIKVFKIDAMKLRSYESKENLKKLFILLREKSNGEIIFNLDVTADKRSGYFMFNEFGIVFLENRYHTKGQTNSYKPYLTLKNQWDIANFVPLQNLQIEVLNTNNSGYDDDYMFAITLFANPLCWFEPSNLSETKMKAYGEMIRIYKKHRTAIQKASVLSIGQGPNDHANTGLMSYNEYEKYAYLLLFREDNDCNQYSYEIELLKNKKITNINYIINNNDGEIKCLDGTIKMISKQAKSFMLIKLDWE